MKRNWNCLAWLLGAAILFPAGTSANEDKESETDAAASHKNLITANPFGFVSSGSTSSTNAKFVQIQRSDSPRATRLPTAEPLPQATRSFASTRKALP